MRLAIQGIGLTLLVGALSVAVAQAQGAGDALANGLKAYEAADYAGQRAFHAGADYDHTRFG